MHLVAPYNDYLLKMLMHSLSKKNLYNYKIKHSFMKTLHLNTLLQKIKTIIISVFRTSFKRIEQGETFNPETGKELLNTEAKRKLGIDISIFQNAGASIVQQLAVALLKLKNLQNYMERKYLNK